MRAVQELRDRPDLHAKDPIPQSSDIYCLGGSQSTRSCRVRNLCQSVNSQRFFLLRSPSSHELNFNPYTTWGAILDLTTITEHNVFFWLVDDAPGNFFLERVPNLDVRTVDITRDPKDNAFLSPPPLSEDRGDRVRLTIVKGRTYLTKRFYPPNIMHNFHDDWLGLYSLRDLWPSLVDPYDDYYYYNDDGVAVPWPTNATSARPDHGITFFDTFGKEPYDAIYEWLGRLNMVEDLLGWDYRSSKDDLPRPLPEEYICYEDAVVGNSKSLAWYQYGFSHPQGPIPEHTANGHKMREAALYALRKLGVPAWDSLEQARIIKLLLEGHQTTRRQSKDSSACIAIFSRRRTRVILNEDKLAKAIEEEFGLPICWIRLEDQPVPELVKTLYRAVMAFGMHGSLLVLSLFMPPGAVLVEGFPYAVPPENYTPYKTMIELPHMHMSYRSWKNTDPNATISYPERPASEGGIRHLDASTIDFILESKTIPRHTCCKDPHWLFRIFQDTFVDVDQVLALFREALHESYQRLPDAWKNK